MRKRNATAVFLPSPTRRLGALSFRARRRDTCGVVGGSLCGGCESAWHCSVMRAVETAVVDHFYGGSMIKDVVRACVASDTITDIRAFMQQHSAEFDQSSLDGGTEHRLEYTVIHGDYCRLIESHLTAALERHGKTLQV